MAFQFIQDNKQFGKLLEHIESAKIVSFDVETTGIDPYTSRLLLVQLKINDTIFILDAKRLNMKMITYVISLIKDRNCLVIGHNIKFDLKIIYNSTGELLINVFDTMLAEMIINNGLRKKFYPSLSDVCGKYCGITLEKDIRDTFIDHVGEFTQEQLIYSALDVEYLVQIYQQQLETIIKQNQKNVMELEMDLVPAFAMIEYTGIGFDRDKWVRNIVNKQKELEDSREKIIYYIMDNVDFAQFHDAAEIADAFSIPVRTKKLRSELETLQGNFRFSWFSENFNIDSYVQLKVALNMLGFETDSVSEKALSKYRDHELIKLILDKYKDASKKLSTYGEGFLDNIHPVTGRVHTEYNQLGTVTGRLSSDNPNLQNQPREKEYRECYIASQGYKLITIDYSQAELRVVGAVSGDPEFFNVFINNLDPHAHTATFLHVKPIEEIDDEERHDGKTLNFAVIYGTSEYGLLYNFGIPLEKGRKYLDSYFNGYKVFKYFKDKASQRIWDLKYSVTPFGRKRFFEDKVLYADSRERYAYEYQVKREGFNMIIQGGVADIIKIAMKNIFYNTKFSYDSCRILLQTHDEIVVEVRDDIVEDAKKFLEKEMLDAEQPFLGKIPAKVDIHVSNCWSKTDE